MPQELQQQQGAPQPAGSPEQKGKDQKGKEEYNAAECAAVKMWATRIRKAKKKWSPDFDRMREDMDFVYGLQWEGQSTLKFHKYVCNITLQMANQKVATLYAKNPQAKATRRKRKDFRIWDERQETLQQAVMSLQQSMMAARAGMGVPDMSAAALLQDYQQGRMLQEIVQRVCDTLEILYQYELDAQEPDFKEMMKQLVRRVVVCGVGYVRLNFARDVQNAPSATTAPRSAIERVRRAKMLLDRIEKGEIPEDDPSIETLKQLAASFGAVATSEQVEVQERLVVDYPPATAIIVDEKCTNLKTFTNARWVCQEYILPLDEVNSFFEVDIKPGNLEKNLYTEAGQQVSEEQFILEKFKDESIKPMVCLWEIFDITTKSTFFIVDGHKEYVQKPEAVTPGTRRFWPIFGLTFNDTVVEAGCKASVYPPSDVRLMFSPQKEWNRSRHSLRGQRRANAAKYIVRRGLLTDEDKEKLDSAEENEVIELAGIPNDVSPDKFILPANHAPIDPMAYDTNPLEKDIMYAARTQEANMGPAPKNVTATVGTIAEQSRMTVASSNVDDLDSLLTALARSAGEMLLWEMSPDTVQHIVGPGASWPMENRADFVNQIELSIAAASSGRPNKAIEIANFERIAPLLMQMQANPMFMIREAVKRLDDQLDVNEAFPVAPLPLVGPQGPQPPTGGPPGGPQPPSPSGPQQPLQELPSGTSVPLPGV